MSESQDRYFGPQDEASVEFRATDFLQRRRYWKWSEEDQKELDAWLNESMVHRVAFLRLEAGLSRTERLAALSPSKFKRSRPAYISFLAKAAIGVAVVGMLAAGARLYFASPKDHVFATAIGGHEIVTLGDGSKIELNTDTVVRTDVDTSHRRASIDKGEAYFQIAHDESSPFVVTVNGHLITVLGTKFSVRAESKRTEISLFEGRVWFSAGPSSSHEKTALLTPGDVLVATANSAKIIKKSDRDMAMKLGWRHDVLIFNNTKFSDAVAEFNRYNGKKIVIADPHIAEMRIGGTFQTRHVDDFTRLAQAVLGLRVRKVGHEILITR